MFILGELTGLPDRDRNHLYRGNTALLDFFKAVGLGLNKLFQRHFEACGVAWAYCGGMCKGNEDNVLVFAICFNGFVC